MLRKKTGKKLTAAILMLSLISSGFVISAQQQSRETLERQRSSLLKEIQETRQLLDATQKDRTASMTQLKALQSQLNARERLINNISQEMGQINNSISHSNSEIKVLSETLRTLKKQYAQSVRYAYKNQNSQSLLAFLFSASSFNEAMHRYQYMKKSRDFRMNQAGKIEVTQTGIKKHVNNLNSEKSKKVLLLSEEEKQKAGIQEERNVTNAMVLELRGKEKDLSSQIANSQASAKRLDAAIKAEIRKEVELARAKAAAEAKKRAEEEARIAAAAEAKRRAEEELARKKAEEERKRQELVKWEEENRRRAADEAAAEKAKRDAAAKAAADKDKAAKERVTSTSKPAANSNDARPAATTGNSKPAPENTAAASKNKPATPPNNSAAKPLPASPPAPRITSSANSGNAVPPKPATTNHTNTNPSYKLSLTPEVQTISNNFAANRGRLPWPVESGFIAVPFGRYQHPLEPKVTMENSGIDIAANAGAGVRTVFEGTVSRVVSIAGSYTVIINHGEYFTVYSYLNSVSVKQGDRVSFKQLIGNVGKNDDGENILHFEICRVSGVNNISNENPSTWIAR